MARLPLFVSVAALSLVLAIHSRAASAQPGAYPPVTPVIPPASGSPTTPLLMQKWGIGLHATSAELRSSTDPDSAINLEGGGLHVRYRANQRWGFEVSMDRIQGKVTASVNRDSRPMTLTAMLHFSRNLVWDWYALAGFGGSRELVTSTDASGQKFEIEYRQTHLHLGLGVERRWTNLGIGLELRVIGAARDEEYSPGAPMDGPVPLESSGGMINLVGTYYF